MTNFPYQKNIAGDFFPIIEVGISYKKETVRINALVDSGATVSVFKTQVAEFLKLPVRAGKQIYLGGVGGRIKGYVHNLEFKIADKKLIAPIVFSYEYNVSFNLLGREAVFRNFKVIFEEKDYLVKLE